MRTAISVFALVLAVTLCGSVAAQTDCSETRVVLWLHVPKDALEDLVNRAVPEWMEGTEAFDTPLLFREYIEWAMARLPIWLAAEGNGLRAGTVVAGSVKVKGWTPVGTAFSAGADIEVEADLWLQPRLASDWRLHPNVRANGRVYHAMMKILGVDVSVRSLSQLVLDRYLGSMEDRINGSIAERPFLREQVERVWRGMHRVDRVPVGRLPGDTRAWFVSAPTRIGATDLRVTEAGFDVGVFVSAETGLVVGDRPRPMPSPLPPIERYADLPAGSVELSLPIYADWKTLNGLIAAGLEEPIVHEGDYYSLEISEAELSYDNRGASVVASVTAKAKPKGWIGWIVYYIHRFLSFLGWDTGYLRIYTDHLIAISARPSVSADGRRVLLEDARFMPQSAHLMETLAADYHGLTEETLRASIRRHVVADLGGRLDEAEGMARAKVSEFTRALGDRGLDLDVEIRPVTRFASVSATRWGLIARFCAAADVGAKIDLGGI